MKSIKIKEIVLASKGRLIQGNENAEILGVCTDSRLVQKTDMFVPTVGEVNDAHRFLPQVFEAGCRNVMVSHAAYTKGLDFPEDANVILVEDTLAGLQSFAAWYLRSLNAKVIGVTGSVGKTSTRDMVYSILKTKFVAGTAKKNLNSDVGVPLAIFALEPGMEAVVLEMGMDRAGEIHRLANMVRPDVGIITSSTNIHIEYLKTKEAILHEKMRITDFMDENNTLVINQSSEMLAGADFDGAYAMMRVGKTPDCTYYVHDICEKGIESVTYTLTADGKDYEVKLNVPGAHNAINSALAIAACSNFGISIEEAIKGLSEIQLTGSRLNLKKVGELSVLDDSYNAGPDSVRSAITTLMGTEAKRHVAILAGMNELGEASDDLHEEVGQFIAEKDLDLLIVISKKAEHMAIAYKKACDRPCFYFETKDDFYKAYKENRLLEDGDMILLKGSRGHALEDVLKFLQEEEGK